MANESIGDFPDSGALQAADLFVIQRGTGANTNKKVLPTRINAVVNPNAKTWYVDTINGNDSNTGHSPGAAFQTLQAAITAVTDDAYGDTIYLMKGYLQSNTAISITKSVNIVSLGCSENEPARFGNGTVVTIVGKSNMQVSFTGVAFVALDNLPLIINNAPTGPTGVNINLQGCVFNYSYSSAFVSAISAQIQVNGTCAIFGNNNTFGGTVISTSAITRNTMLQIAANAGPVSVNLSANIYTSARFTNTIKETFIYSLNTNPSTYVKINGIDHSDVLSQTDTTASDIFMLDTGAAHNINISGYTYKCAYQVSPSANPILRLANSNNAAAGSSIIINNALIDYGPLANAQISLGNVTGSNDKVYINWAIFKTTGSYTLASSGNGAVVSSYIDGAGVMHSASGPNPSTYFIDTVNGNDLNNGTSIYSPLKTLSQLQTLAPNGAVVIVATGSTFATPTTFTKQFNFFTAGNVNITAAMTFNVGASFTSPNMYTGFTFSCNNINDMIMVNSGLFVMMGGTIDSSFDDSYAGSGLFNAVNNNGTASLYFTNVFFGGTLAATTTSVIRATQVNISGTDLIEVIFNNCYYQNQRLTDIPASFFYSTNTNAATRVWANDQIIEDGATSLTSAGVLDMFMLDTNAAHVATVNTLVFGGQIDSSPLAIFRLGNCNNAGAGAAIVFNAPTIPSYSTLGDAQVIPGVVTGANGKIFVNDGIFNTSASRSFTPMTNIFSTYWDGAGIYHTPMATGISFTNQNPLVITHNLNKQIVNIILTDTATPPNKIEGGGVEFTDENNATISFSGPTSGVAYVS